MATARINFSFNISDNFLDTEGINPPERELTIEGLGVRRSVTLPDGESITLDVGEITPVFWYFQNIHATNDLILSFGSTDDITLPPGLFAFLPSGQIPIARGDGESKLVYAAYE